MASEINKKQIIFDHDSGYVTLTELSQHSSYSLNYLQEVARSGKLKSFKVGGDWLTTVGWYCAFEDLIKKELSSVVDISGDMTSKWVSLLPIKKVIKKKKKSLVNFWLATGFLRLRVKPVIATMIIFWVFALGAWVMSAPIIGADNIALASTYLYQQRAVVTDGFIRATAIVYVSPIKLGVAMGDAYTIALVKIGEPVLVAQEQIDDFMIASINSLISGGNSLIALEISDDIVTDQWQKFVVLSNEVAGQKLGRVAGATADAIVGARSQNNYDYWADEETNTKVAESRVGFFDTQSIVAKISETMSDGLKYIEVGVKRLEDLTSGLSGN
ncbi:MAG TPA: hypothetical protein VJB67_00720 [Patescibacteria group bacterium]|nr:hypothetical protein [Patescibacteria group bacterium]